MKSREWKLFVAVLLLGSFLFYSLSFTGDIHLSQTSMIQRLDSAVQEEEQIMARMQGPVSYDDPALLEVIRSKYLTPPSTLPYNLTEDRTYNQYQSMGIFLVAKRVVRHFFSNITGGTFVEAGALDGQFLSNTLSLEKDQGWTGLLVEAGELSYKNILQRQRKAWVSHSCLALHPYPHTAILGTIVGEDPSWFLMFKGQAALLDSRTSYERRQREMVSYERVQCLPAASLLLALNITAVDYFSLDVEDVEEAIVENFPFDRITVDVWYIEHRMPNSTLTTFTKSRGPDMAFVGSFWKKGYTFYPTDGDYVFVRNGSKYSLLPPLSPHTFVRGTKMSYSVQYIDKASKSG